MTNYQQYIHLSRYARWNDEVSRRETWSETPARYCDFFANKFGDVFPYKLAYNAIFTKEVMPSMRALMTAGEALTRDNVAGFNCSYVPIDNVRAFDEILYILSCGTGVGFSVESRYVNKLPNVSDEIRGSDTTIFVPDSKLGWASSLKELIALLYSGRVPRWDLSRLRPAGARLKTFGGRASGPEPLDRLFQYCVELFKKAAGRKLRTVECFDLVCKIADVIIVGGVRRSALICLCDLNDDSMRLAKTGQWWIEHPHRALANISAVYEDKPEFSVFLKEWQTLYESKSGERGIFNRRAAQRHAGKSGRREWEGYDYGTNPCGEIILRPNGFCNLTEVVVRPEDNEETLRSKVEIATILGTFQSTLTDFRYLRKIWKDNADEERLLGVSLTGIFDNKFLLENSATKTKTLQNLKDYAIAVNKEWAKRIGINPSHSITCIKPSGTVSQLVGCSSGIHPSFSSYYIRNVRGDNKDPITKFLISQGVPNEPEKFHPNDVTVFAFPTKAPEGSVTKDEVSALEHLRLYEEFRNNWCEHNPSITVYYNDDNFLEVGDWVWKNWDNIGGISFLPQADHIYEQAPYQPITEEKYKELIVTMPDINWANYYQFEKEDQTTNTHELACSAGLCEI